MKTFTKALALLGLLAVLAFIPATAYQVIGVLTLVSASVSAVYGATSKDDNR